MSRPPQERSADPVLDGRRIRNQLDQVRRFMLANSWQWMTLREIGMATGYPESSVSARLRDCRKALFGGYVVERRRRANAPAGTWEYRVLKPKPEARTQSTLFDVRGEDA